MDKKPLFWYRPCSDGAYEGPIHDSSIEEVRKQSGAWKPLFDHSGDATDMAAEIERIQFKLQRAEMESVCAKREAAASQARELQLRDSIIRFRNEKALERASSIRATEGYAAMEHAALNAPRDTSALEAMIAKAGEVMRERCAEKIESQHAWITSAAASALIRALPGVTLEDLK